MTRDVDVPASGNVARSGRLHPIVFVGLCLLVVAVMLATKGRRHVDLPALLQLHSDPWAKLGAQWSFLYGSPLNPLIGYALGIKSVAAIRAFYTDLAIGAWMIVPLVYYIRNPIQGRTALYLYCLTPISFVLISWLGKSDSLLLASYAIVFFSRRPAIYALGICLSVLAHKEQGLIIVALHLLLQRKYNVMMITAAATGVVAGLIMHTWYQHYLPIVPATRMDFFLSTNARAIKLNSVEIPIEAFSVFGAFWLPLWRHAIAISGVRRYKLLIACVVAVFLPFATYDYTRVAAMLALPVYFHVIEFWVVDENASAAEACGLKAGMLAPLLLIAFMAAMNCQADGFLNKCDCYLHD